MMPNSVIEAIKNGVWSFEPKDAKLSDFPSTRALPGTEEKVRVLAERLQNGQPLWHPNDRITMAGEDAA
jgi:hypothetical protein